MNVVSSLYNALYGRQTEKPLSPIERLPQDMLVIILQSIDSLRSLRAAVLASSAMHDAFRSAKTETLARVVSHSRPGELDEDTEALSAFMRITSHEKKAMTKTEKALVNYYLWHPQEEWPFLPKSLFSPELLHFHWYVEYFTEKLFKASMRHLHQKGWLGSKKLRFRRLSHIETVRIQRALYRLEIFSAYHRLDPTDPKQLIRSPRWRSHVQVWEMEEVACVQNLIFHRLAVLDPLIESLIHYMDLASDTELKKLLPSARSNKTRLVEQLTSIIKSLITSHGLSVLFRVLSEPEAQTTRRFIRDIMREAFLPPSGTSSSRRSELLFHLYVQPSHGSISSLMFMGRENEQPCTLSLERLRIREDTPEHPSFGYFHAYRTKTLRLIKSGNMSRTESSLYNGRKHHEDRKWGYCLWDSHRMEVWRSELAGSAPKTTLQVRVTSQGSPRWTTTRLN
jgi:hypothetical protein